MKRNRILHLADLHLGDRQAFLGAKADDRRREADSVLSRIADSILQAESAIGGVVIAGDLFDSHEPPRELVQSVLTDLGRLYKAGIRVLTIPGNHDEYSYPACVYRKEAAHWPDLLVSRPNPGRVATWNLEGLEVDLYAMAYVAGRSRPPYDQFQIEPSAARKMAVLHGSLDTHWSDRSLPLSSESLSRLDLDYVALGHIHRPMERRLGRALAAYPGRIEGGGFDDPGGADLLEIDLSGAEPILRHLPWPSRRHDELLWEVSALSAPEELETRLAGEVDPERILRLRLEGLPSFPLDEAALWKRFAPGFYHLELVCSEWGRESPSLEALCSERTIRGLFAQVAAREIAATTSEQEREIRRAALRLGLAAFAREEGS